MRTTPIKTYSGVTFRERYLQAANALLKADFEKFFVVRVEELSRLMKVPVPPVRVNNHALVYLMDGEVVISIGYETYQIVAGECLIVPAGQVFSLDKVDHHQGYLCIFHNDFIISKTGNLALLNSFEFLQVWGNPRLYLDAQTSDFVAHLFNRLLLDYNTHGLTKPGLIQSYLTALLYEIDRAYQPASAGLQTHAVLLTNQFKALLFAHRKTHHLVTDYASLLSVTPNHLNKSVKAITGKSPIKWIDEAIVLEAKVLLHQTYLSISEVAAQVGIMDASYFSRLFKKYEGITPVGFRRMIEKS